MFPLFPLELKEIKETKERCGKNTSKAKSRET